MIANPIDVWTIARGILKVLSVVSFFACIALSLKYCEQAQTLDTANEEIEVKAGEIFRLKTALSLQNESIEQLNQQTEMAQIEADAAMKVAQANNRTLAKAIEEIRAVKATECADTAPMVSSAIEALKQAHDF